MIIPYSLLSSSFSQTEILWNEILWNEFYEKFHKYFLHSFLKIKSGSLSQDGLKMEKDYAIFLCLFFATLSDYEKVRNKVNRM